MSTEKRAGESTGSQSGGAGDGTGTAKSTSLAPWRPLSQRARGQSPALVEGVPSHLEQRLRRWLARTVSTTAAHDLADRVLARLHYDVVDLAADFEPVPTAAEALAWHLLAEDLLDAVDATLYLHPAHDLLAQAEAMSVHWPEQSLMAAVYSSTRQAAATPLQLAVASLTRLLTDCDSVWTVAPDTRSLRRRRPLAENVQLSAVLQATTSAATGPMAGYEAACQLAAADLAEADRALHGLHPDPSNAYRLAIRAVEHAAVPVVMPQNTKATLGQVTHHLRDAPGKWQLATGADGSCAAAMMATVWSGHSDRHGGQPGEHTPTLAAAQVALSLATTLVGWFATGQLRRIS